MERMPKNFFQKRLNEMLTHDIKHTMGCGESEAIPTLVPSASASC
jgi:hypothetical protein